MRKKTVSTIQKVLKASTSAGLWYVLGRLHQRMVDDGRVNTANTAARSGFAAMRDAMREKWEQVKHGD